MHVALSEAKSKLTDLVRRAEAGEEILLTRRGQPTVRLVPVVTDATREKRRALLTALRGSATNEDGVTAAQSADFLYDENGLPA